MTKLWQLLLAFVIGCLAPLCMVSYPRYAQPVKADTLTQAGRTQRKPVKPLVHAVTPQLEGYLARLRAKLLRVWQPVDGKNVVILEATLSPQGEVSDLITKNSRANDLAIQSATAAFKSEQPLEPPAPLKNPSRLTLNFFSEVDPHGDSKINITSQVTPMSAKSENASGGKQDNN
jgi:hypothetical protein